MHATNPRPIAALALALVTLGLAAVPDLQAAPKSFPDKFQEKWETSGPNVRIKRHQDGSRTQFQRSRDDTTLVKRTYGSNGNLKMVAVYRLGPSGDPIACKIFDGGKTLLYKVAYGFDLKTGRLKAEKMYDARTRRIDRNNPTQEQPVRVMYYSYDAQGKPTRPEVFTFHEGQRAEDAYRGSGTFPHDNPFKTGR